MIHVNSAEISMLYNLGGLRGPTWMGIEGRSPRDGEALRVLFEYRFNQPRARGDTRVDFATYENNLTYFVTEWKKALACCTSTR